MSLREELMLYAHDLYLCCSQSREEADSHSLEHCWLLWQREREHHSLALSEHITLIQLDLSNIQGHI